MSTLQKTRPKKLDLGCAGISMTADEFDAIRDADGRFRYELIRGVLIVSRLTSEAEADPNEELGHLLRVYRDSHPQGSILNTTLPERYVYSGANRRRADRLVWSGLNRIPVTEVDLPTIAIEFVSASKRDWLRDYEEKRAEDASLGIPEYWIINRFDRTMTVYRCPPAEPLEQVIPADGIYRTPLLPGFELPLAKILRIADLWPKRKRRIRKPPAGNGASPG